MSGYDDDDPYIPANRPPNAPGGDRVRFEREGDHEQLLLGGGAQGIEESILRSTERNIQLIGKRIVGMSDTTGDLGSGSMQELVIQLSDGKEVRVTGIGLAVEIR